MKKSLEKNIIAENKKAKFDYEILDAFEAGIELKGYEVKAIRAGNVNLKGSYVSFAGNEAIIKNMHIGYYKYATLRNLIDPKRDRKIFLHKKTIFYLMGKSKEAGKTIIPLEIYGLGNLIKVKICLCQGRKKYNKKQLLKERTLEKEAKIKLKKFY